MADPMTMHIPMQTMLWLLEKPSRIECSTTSWCNKRLEFGLEAFPSHRWWIED